MTSRDGGQLRWAVIFFTSCFIFFSLAFARVSVILLTVFIYIFFIIHVPWDIPVVFLVLFVFLLSSFSLKKVPTRKKNPHVFFIFIFIFDLFYVKKIPSIPRYLSRSYFFLLASFLSHWKDVLFSQLFFFICFSHFFFHLFFFTGKSGLGYLLPSDRRPAPLLGPPRSVTFRIPYFFSSSLVSWLFNIKLKKIKKVTWNASDQVNQSKFKTIQIVTLPYVI